MPKNHFRIQAPTDPLSSHQLRLDAVRRCSRATPLSLPLSLPYIPLKHSGRNSIMCTNMAGEKKKRERQQGAAGWMLLFLAAAQHSTASRAHFNLSPCVCECECDCVRVYAY
ncbi:hypothetical protein M431DRAFT_299715 [Trichoderma harzianum CBS 226.95]|uniref:Uncharacterized protein n=1 Tax=Trichoderma harzianum CBS 226.95 TaxID=983964 RepID=A0A2T4AQH0_TRIHA|nr:hypothetical protein M431DRAFT_299715 [Trichoderma harzianum CBS 226.95]PTB59312.1 hypothetical protein M431DRAFT_299715 [Trichoderma harzianum CBS 226.95]